ncbi:MAG: hypothetical protein H6R23_2439, partial [Proteobacteria bacterium]|nr:hypothetical protein [Pseudomonadota bacterium]
PRTLANFRDFLSFFISLSMGCREEQLIRQNEPIEY